MYISVCMLIIIKENVINTNLLITFLFFTFQRDSEEKSPSIPDSPTIPVEGNRIIDVSYVCEQLACGCGSCGAELPLTGIVHETIRGRFIVRGLH